MKTIKVKWTGIRPLILSNPQTVQLSNKHAVESRRINALLKAARKKQDEHKLAELEQQQILNDWKASAYYDDKVNKFFVPDTLILACIKNGAMAGRKGKDIDRAVLITETAVHIETPTKHNSIQGYFNDPAFRLECPCKVPPKTGALIWKARCMIPTGWSIQFQIEYNENIIADKSLTEALELAGANCGLGGWRPKFGRFLWEEI
jgi:uncharacterized protein YbdZ (MbtH family)